MYRPRKGAFWEGTNKTGTGRFQDLLREYGIAEPGPGEN